MNVLLIGSGGREHALAWKIAQSSLLDVLFIAPGNPGMERHGRCVDLDINDHAVLRAFILENRVRMVVVGPETPLVNGLHDRLADDHALHGQVTVIGPRKAAAQLEGSKHFAKEFMRRHHIPTAAHRSFGRAELPLAIEHLDRAAPPYVIKADGLAAGKGVVITDDRKEAKQVVQEMLKGERFGKASDRVVIEQFMKGVEASAFVLTDGQTFKLLPMAKDYKRVGNADTGANTGGMGAVSPVPFADRDFVQKVTDRIVTPTLKGLREEGLPYQGFLFIGLMNVGGEPYVVEYNVRLGDPEAQAILPRLRADLLDLFEGIATGTLGEQHVEADERTAVTVVLASEGYPGEHAQGKVIAGLDMVQDAYLFQAGTAKGPNGTVTHGGRVLAVTALGKDVEQAAAKAYRSLAVVSYEGLFFRTDIGADLARYPVPKSGAASFVL
jgi:phosphoribosylamine---glycine ligase